MPLGIVPRSESGSGCGKRAEKWEVERKAAVRDLFKGP